MWITANGVQRKQFYLNVKGKEKILRTEDFFGWLHLPPLFGLANVPEETIVLTTVETFGLS